MTPGKKKAKPTKAPDPATTRKTEPDSTEANDSGKRADPNFPIVGIGASAGGLAAFESFFSGMPEDVDPGMAFRIHKKIRNMMIFSEQDVIKDPPFSRLDLICCRNLLIYI